jgi:hypothetical protein
MASYYRIPKPPLSNFVRMLWYFDGAPSSHAKERILPTGTVEIIINLKEDVMRVYDRNDTRQCQAHRGIGVVGILTEYAVIDTDEQMQVMGVNFAPGGAFPFLTQPVSELQDLHLSLDELWGPSANTLRERLLELTTIDARFDLLESALNERILAYDHHPAVRFALHEMSRRHALTVAALVDKIGISSRRFIQLFSTQVVVTWAWSTSPWTAATSTRLTLSMISRHFPASALRSILPGGRSI